MKSKEEILERYNELHKERVVVNSKILSGEYIFSKAYLDWRAIALEEALDQLDWILDRRSI